MRRWSRWWRGRDVRMREPDARRPDFHLLEELSLPPACVNGSRVSVWVYRQTGSIRRIVLSGHAELATCKAATSILIEGIKKLSPSASWMLTCGAAYFQVTDAAGSPATFADQAVLHQMIAELNEMQEYVGLVNVFERDWRVLEVFRTEFRRGCAGGGGRIVLPSPRTDSPLADYFPILPAHDSNGRPLRFRLEGWDFDCPAFQAVADTHLRNMRRQLLADALRRRRTYRNWLKEWVEEWIRDCSLLPESEAKSAVLWVPPDADDPSSRALAVDGARFLQEHADGFLDPGQQWHHYLAHRQKLWGYDGAPVAGIDLDLPRRPEKVIVIDFERGRKTERAATEDDAPFTLRQRITENQPGHISECLRYIRRMDAIIKPYEKLRSQEHLMRDADPEKSGLFQVARVSKQIVMETMVRGWPSFYLDDREDEEMFDGWAADYRAAVWSKISEQAKAAGVAPEILLEDNIVYDVRFGTDLECTLEPLMLIDDFSHALVSGPGVGACCGVPLWSRRQTRELPPQVTGSGGNADAARRFVQRAAQLVDAPADPPVGRAADQLRLALACHPVAAGQAILEEWKRRLGRPTRDEFMQAVQILEAAEMAARQNYSDALSRVRDYLGSETQPLPDAYVIQALCELMGDDPTLRQLRDAATVLDAMRRRFESVRAELEKAGLGKTNTVADVERLLKSDPSGENLRRFKQLSQLRDLIDRKQQQADPLLQRREESEKRRREAIESALADPESVRTRYPALAEAALHGRDLLQSILETHCLYRPETSESLIRKYGSVRGVVEIWGLLEVAYGLSGIEHEIANDPVGARKESLEQMSRWARHLWLPETVESDLKLLAEEFGKGDWDRLQAAQIQSVLRSCVGTCLARINDLQSDLQTQSAPFFEALATRIHTRQTIDGHYRLAFRMLLAAQVPLGQCLASSWTVLDRGLPRRLASGASLRFEPETNTVSVVSDGTRHPLLRLEADLTEEDSRFLKQAVEESGLAARIPPLAPGLARGLLDAPVQPSPRFRRWCEVLQRIQPEFLLVSGCFRHQVNLLPELSPLLASQVEKQQESMERCPPRGEPYLDPSWKDLDRWAPLLGPGAERHSWAEAGGPLPPRS